MALTQFMNEWNDSFNFKVSVNDIKKPTQQFLYEALDFFLDTLNIDCAKMKAKMGERHYKIWLVKYYDDFFKTCNPKCHPLYYGDLIQPESKKVSEILRFLLNFHLFHKAVKKEIVDTTNGKIELYNRWLAHKNELQLQQEEAKIQSEQKEEMLKETTRSIADHKQQLEELTAKNAVLTKETEEAMQEVYRIRIHNIELASQIDGMAPFIVTENEMASLFRSIQNANTEISELDAAEKKLQSNNQCVSEQMSQLNAEFKELSTNLNENGFAESVGKERDEMKNLAELKNKVEEFRNQMENAIATRKEQLVRVKSMESQLSNKRNDLGALLGNYQSKLSGMESECNVGSTEAANFEER